MAGVIKAPSRILITGAAGNLGSLLARHLLEHSSFSLNLMIHRKDVAPEIRSHERVQVVRADLGDPGTIGPALAEVDTVIHFAGVLFKARPEKFLPITNLGYFRHLVDAAGAAGVSKVILISFPHVEGETFPESPATGSLDGRPESVHARTRLEEEKYLFETENLFGFQAVSLRLGMVYGNGILMIDAARWMAKRWILGVWREPTWIHLISTPDYLAAATAAIRNKAVRGIYHIGDEGRQTLQEFLDIACAQWRVKKPWRLPVWMIYTAAAVCEAFSGITGVKSPLTRDFITIGRQSYHGDTSRMRNELLPELKFPTLETGKALLRLPR